MKFETFKLSEIEKMIAEYNPRKKLSKRDPEYIKLFNSINELGYSEPLIINKRRGNKFVLVSGHQRLTVLKDLGYNELECGVVNLNKTKEKQLNIALNKITGNWDEEKLKDILKELEEISKNDALLTGFSEEEVNKIFGEMQKEVEKNNEFQNDFDVIGQDEKLENNSGGHLHKSSSSSCIFNFHTFRITYSDDIEIVKKVKKMAEIMNDESTDSYHCEEIIVNKMLEALEEIEREIDD